MDSPKPPQPADGRAGRRPAVSQLRWLALTGILLAAGSTGRISAPLIGVCVTYGLWLLWLGLSAQASGRRTSTNGFGAAVDAMLPALGVSLSGGTHSPLWWAFLLPAATMAVPFGVWGAAGLGVGAWALAAGVSVVLPTAGEIAWQMLILTGVGVAAGGLVVAWLSVHRPARAVTSDPQLTANEAGESQRLLGVLSTTTRLNETTALDQLALRIVELVQAALRDDANAPVVRPAGLWIGSPEEGDWEVTVGFAPGDVQSRDGGPGALEDALQTGEPCVVTSPNEDSFVRRWVGLGTEDAAVIVPLSLLDGTSLGAVIMGLERRDVPSAAGLSLLRNVGINAALAWENANRYRALLREKDRLAELQEEARKRLARNLHDGPTQSIASIAMRANFARRQITRDPDVAIDEVAKVEEMARQTTREIRHMLFTLRPLILESQGLGPALYQLALKARDSHDEDIQLEIDPDSTDGMDLGVQGALFYIVEEAVTNAQKHAAAQHIWIRLKQKQGGLRLEVEDDGVGFNVGAVDAHYDQRGSLGMVNMRERAELAGGVLTVQSTEGEGTLISVSLPTIRPSESEQHE
jgi:signal transduction histidine kinase